MDTVISGDSYQVLIPNQRCIHNYHACSWFIVYIYSYADLTGAVRLLIISVVSELSVGPKRPVGLTVLELILGLLVGPVSCWLRAPATDAALLRP